MATETGRRAETLAAAYLRQLGFKILAQNWRTRYCEIDLVAQRGRTIHLVEVKFRSDPAYGEGYDYITPAKARRLIKAAEYYQMKAGRYLPIQIDVITITGPLERASIELIENVTG